MNRIRLCFALLLLFAMAFTASSENSETRLKAGATFKNESNEPVYLIYEIAPGGEFKNTTVVDFTVKAKKDFLRQNFQVELESKISAQEDKVARISSAVTKLDQSVQTVKKRE